MSRHPDVPRMPVVVAADAQGSVCEGIWSAKVLQAHCPLGDAQFLHGSVWLQIVRVFAVAVVGLSSMAAYARSEAVRLPQQCHEHRLCLESLISWVYYMSLERCQCSNQLLFHERQEVEVGRTWHFAFKVAKW